MNEFNPSEYQHSCKVWVRYADLDTMGHVNNKSYLSYLEESRIDFHAKALGFDVASLAFNAVVGSITIRYIKPILIENQVIVFTRCSKIGGSSFELESIICINGENNTNPIPAANASVTLININPNTGKPEKISEEMRKMLDGK